MGHNYRACALSPGTVAAEPTRGKRLKPRAIEPFALQQERLPDETTLTTTRETRLARRKTYPQDSEKSSGARSHEQPQSLLDASGPKPQEVKSEEKATSFPSTHEYTG